MRKHKKCIHDGTCTREIYAVGLCRSHYQECRRLIREGHVTQVQLEKAGRIESRRPAKMWFLEGVTR